MKHIYAIALVSIVAGINVDTADPEPQKLIELIQQCMPEQCIAVDLAGAIRERLNQNDVNVFINGQGFLHFAAAYGSIGVMQMLCDKGADINLHNGIGYSPLHYAARNGRSKAVTFLLTHGADLSKRSCSEKTPADLAKANGHTKTAELIDHWEDTSDIKEPECN